MRLTKVFGWRQRIGLIFFGSLMIAVSITSPVPSLSDEIRLLLFALLGATLIVGSLIFRRDVWQVEHTDNPED